MKKLTCLLILLSLLPLAGCATIVKGPSKELNVTTNPSGASVVIGENTRISPTKFLLGHSRVYVVKITKEGYKPMEVDVERGLSGWVFFNILFGPGAVIAFPFDAWTDNAWRTTPKEIKVNLEPIETNLGDGKIKEKK